MDNVAENIIKEVASSKENEEEGALKNVQLVVFELDKEEYAVEITDLQEVLRIPDITPIPNAPDFIKGIFNLRGKILVVIDLERRFNLVRDNENTEEGNIIFAEVNENSYGIIVDKVTQIINVARDTVQATPGLVSSKIHADYLKGVVVLEDKFESDGKTEKKDKSSRLIILLDLQKMLQEKELLSIGKTIKEAVK